jgi:methylphosphotriester-DNA--protein-cysteine methyltransferase
MQLLEAQQAAGTGVGVGSVPSDVDGLFAAGTASYHVPGCRLVDGREEISYVTAAEAQASDLKPCRVCQPELTSNVSVR